MMTDFLLLGNIYAQYKYYQIALVESLTDTVYIFLFVIIKLFNFNVRPCFYHKCMLNILNVRREM